MKTLEQLKNDYAKTQHYGSWNELLLNNDAFTVGNLHLNNVMKIYARECLKLASENAFNHFIAVSDSVQENVRKAITNENNIIK